jgi:hypothetical protein
MLGRSYRPLLAVGTLGVALLGASSLFWQSSEAATAGPSVIEVNDEGFNPPVCSVGRNNEVAWKNVGTQVRRVVAQPVGLSDPVPLTEDIQPGQTSSAVIPGAGGQLKYQDLYNPSLKGIIQTPQRSNDGPINCSALPPTPTPTPTPLPTPSPVVSANCRARALGAADPVGRCAIAPAVVADSAGP